MSKINTSDATTLTNETSFISLYNANNALIETASDTFLSLDGTSPNSMSADIDMNSNRILNLPGPSAAEEPLRLQDLSDFIGGGTITAGAPTNASYVTLGTNSTLTSERVLTAGTGVTFTDGGAGSTLTLSAVGISSILDYGAVASDAAKGVTNQTAIHAALATGRPVYIPDGQTFYVSAITIPTNAHSIFGRGTLIAAGSISAAALFIGTSNTNFSMNDVTIQINTTTYATLDAVNLTSGTDIFVDGVTANGYNGILTTNCTRPSIHNCHITDFNNIGIVDRGSTDVEFYNNRVTTTNVTTSNYGIQASASSGVGISSNWVSNAFSFGIVVSGLDSGAYTPVNNVTIANNHVVNVGLEAINLANVTNFTVTGNIARWTGSGGTASRDFGISCYGDPNTSPVGTSQIGTISGNTVFNPGKAGIVLANNCQYVTISGNTIHGANALNGATVYHISGILVYGRGALHNKVHGNNIIDPSSHLTWCTNEYDDTIGAGSGPNYNSFSNNDGVGSSGGSNIIGTNSWRGIPEFYLAGAGTTTGLGPVVVFRPSLTVTDAGLALQDDVDTTKQGRIQLSGVTTGQTRTLTWPDADGSILIKSKLVIPFNSQSGVGGAGVTSFFLIGASATELNIYGVSPVTGTFKNLYVNLNTAPGGIQTDTITLRVNGSDTSITTTVTGAAVSGNDTTHTASITAGQTFSIKIVGSASAAATIINGGIELDTI